jgi:glyoxylase-like metal-dependent hydrolase (beta-lactamase superfamily II)
MLFCFVKVRMLGIMGNLLKHMPRHRIMQRTVCIILPSRSLVVCRANWKTVYVDEDGEEVTVADITMRVLSTPGHTEGSCCYYIDDGEQGHYLISGDTLFEQSVGRTDLPTGSMGELVRSIRSKLFVLPDDTKVFTGHGGFTSIGFEKENNYFV